MQLDLSSLQNAVLRLDEALILLNADPGNAITRDAVIQRFEFTYELSWKMLKRYLEMTAANPAVFDEISFQNLIRQGSEQGLLKSGWDEWWQYRDARSITSHTYNEAKAKEVIVILPDFLIEAKFLLNMLKTRSQF